MNVKIETERYIMRFDGLSKPNPGLSSAGCVIYSPDGTKVYEEGVYMGYATNNQAEYTGFITGIKAAINLGIRCLHVEGDSMIVVQQVKGVWKVGEPRLKILFNEAQVLMSEIPVLTIEHVYRKFNKEADRITNDVIQSKQSYILHF